ncbi:hypothetical protein pb186bvf_017142 [Paramecium bursaria]
MDEDRQKLFLLEQNYNTAKNKLIHKDSKILDLQNKLSTIENKNNEMDLKIKNLNQIIQENEVTIKQLNEKIQKQEKYTNKTNIVDSNLHILQSKLQNKKQKFIQKETEYQKIIELSSTAIQTSQLLVERCVKCASYINIIHEKQQQDLQQLNQYQEQKKSIIEFIENDRKSFDLDKILASNKDDLQLYKSQLDEQLKEIKEKREKFRQAKDKEIQSKIAFVQQNIKQ